MIDTSRAVPVRPGGHYRLVMQKANGGAPSYHPNTFDAASALAELRLQMGYMSDGARGAQVARQGNVSVLKRDFHADVYLWVERVEQESEK